MTEPAIPRLRAPDLAYVARTRRYIVDVAAYSFYELELVGETLTAFTAALAAVFPKAPYRAVEDSCRLLAGCRLTSALLREFAWRMAGNASLLARGVPVRPWGGQLASEWVPLQVLQALPSRNNRGAFGCEFLLQVMAGTPCPLRFTKFWTRGQYSYLARLVGFVRPRFEQRNLPFEHASQFVGLRFCGLFSPDTCKYGLDFRQTGVPGTHKHWNQQLLRQRYRIDYVCPQGFTHACHRCPVGYDTCPTATHPRTYYAAACDSCYAADAVFDPAVSSQLCLACAAKQRLGGH